MNQPMTKAFLIGLMGLAAFLSGCTTPVAPATGKVVIPTPYGSNSRSAVNSFFQSTVVPQNLESLVDHFRVYLRGTNGAVDRPSFIVPYGQAAEFVFDDVPPGTYNLDVLAFQYANETAFDIDGGQGYNNGSVIARGRYNGIVVNSGGLVVTPLVTVSPINQDHGTFELTLRGIPSDVNGYSVDYNIVFINNTDGSFELQPFGGPDGDSNGTLDYIENATFPDYLETPGLVPDGSLQQLTLKTNTNYAIQTGTFFLRIKLKGADGLYHSFQPQFTIQVFKNLKSTLEVHFNNTLLGEPLTGGDAAALTNLTTTTDGTLEVSVGWGRDSSGNYISHYQIGQTAPEAIVPPTGPEILATLPNLNGIAHWATGVHLQDPTVPKAKFWVRKIYSGMRPSNWAPVVAGFANQGSFSTSLPQVLVTGPVATTAAQPVATFSGSTSLTPASSAWVVDGQTVQTSPTSLDTLVLDTSSFSAGVHKILLKVTDGQGVTYSSAPYSLKVRAVPTGKVVFSENNNTTYWLRPDGTLWGWGKNNDGQLGLGDAIYTPRTSPVYIASNVADVAAGQHHVAVAKTDGTLWAAGDNSSGQYGNGTLAGGSDLLTQVFNGGVPVTGVVAVAAQTVATFILKADGTLWSAGQGTSWSLGQAADTPTFTQVATDVKEVQTGFAAAFALKNDGTLWATGLDESSTNQLGVTGNALGFTTINLTGTVTSFSLGRFDSFVVKGDGTLWAVGENLYGNEGHAGGPNLSFQQVPGVTGVKAVSAGVYHTVILMNDGTVKTAGENEIGALGNGNISATDQWSFETLFGIQGVQSVAAGDGNTAFLTDSGLYLTGYNDFGQVGNGTTIIQAAPVRVDVVPPPMKVVSDLNRNFVIRSDGTLWGAGLSPNGELGDGLTTGYTVFDQVLGASTVVSVATGSNHSLFVTSDGSVLGVGDSSDGQLGVQATTTTPEPLFPPGTAKAVAAGDGFSLILKTDGTVLASGLNTGGVLGQGNTTPLSAFTAILGVDRIVALAAGDDYAFLLRSDGTLFAAGVASGNDTNPLGFPGETTWVAHTTYTPVLTGVTRIATGGSFSAAVKSDGSLWVAGYNLYGQLGLGDTATRNSGFVNVLDGGVEDVATGTGHTLFLRKNKTLWGMGYPVPVGNPGDSNSPSLIASDVLSMAAGGDFTYFVRNDGTLWWMGIDTTNSNGIPGDQSTQPTPQRVVF